MKRVCKQCGKPFELSDSEIAFYRKKNLNLPKRCKECRRANKQGRPVQESEDLNVQKREQDFTGRRGDKVGKWVYALIAVSVLLLPGLTRMLFSPINDGAVPALVSVEDSSIEAEETPQDAAEILQDSIDGEAAAFLHEADEGTEQLQSEADTEKQYTFRNSDLLNEHFEKHGKEMGFSSAEEYQAAASAVVNNVNALHKTEKEDGDDVYYLEATNEFVIVSTDGHIRTYFYPDAGIDYYNRQ